METQKANINYQCADINILHMIPGKVEYTRINRADNFIEHI